MLLAMRAQEQHVQALVTICKQQPTWLPSGEYQVISGEANTSGA